MLSVNNLLFNRNSINYFIGDSINQLINEIPGIREKEEYWLFYFIREDFSANLFSLCGMDIDTDFLGFPVIRKNTRHAIEAFLDLYNLCRDQEYINVLKYCSNKKANGIGKYKNYIHNKQFTIYSKVKIAKEEYDQNFEFLIDIAKESNAFIHPNVYVDVIPVSERIKKIEILKRLLGINIYLLDNGYKLFLNKFHQSLQPYIGCPGCNRNGKCTLCYRQLYDNFVTCINTSLVMELKPEINYFNNSVWR